MDKLWDTYRRDVRYSDLWYGPVEKIPPVPRVRLKETSRHQRSYVEDRGEMLVWIDQHSPGEEVQGVFYENTLTIINYDEIS